MMDLDRGDSGRYAVWVGAGILLLTVLWCAGGYLFAFGIGVLVGLIVAYEIARQYLAGIFV